MTGSPAAGAASADPAPSPNASETEEKINDTGFGGVD
jgi:hypothetical protein